MKESVEKALSFQRPDPAAMRAALQSAGGFRSEFSSATPRVPDVSQAAEPQFDRKLRNLLALPATLNRPQFQLLEQLTRL